MLDAMVAAIPADELILVKFTDRPWESETRVPHPYHAASRSHSSAQTPQRQTSHRDEPPPASSHCLLHWHRWSAAVRGARVEGAGGWCGTCMEGPVRAAHCASGISRAGGVWGPVGVAAARVYAHVRTV